MSELCRLRIRGPLREALRPESLARIPDDALARFLLERRWFGGKGTPPETVRIRDVVPVFDGTAAVARLDLDAGTARAATYQLPLAARRGDAAGAPSPLGTLALLDCDEGTGRLVDGLGDPDFQTRLGDALAGGATFAGPRSQWRVEPIAPHDESRGAPRLLGAEQSNTSLAFGDRSMFKLYRRVTPGTNPDVEIGEFLVRRGRFAHVPKLLATVRFVDQDGEESVAGMLQQFVRSRGDAWAFALERARAEAVDASAPAGEFAAAARELGAVTRELHEALADGAGEPEFEPRPATADDAVAWGEGVARQVKRAGEAIAEQAASSSLAATARPLARTCLEHLPRTLAHVRDLAASFAQGAGQRIRHHGDYHLGQVLVTEGSGFMILDFEGEPARPLAERRRRHSALRDVAGMVRSIAYAAAAAGRLAPAVDASERLERWRHDAREAFLDGYFGLALSPYLPPSREATGRLLELFEIEKAFYELVYEVNNRPDWVEIPLRAIAASPQVAR